ncbi:hypothetical protein ABL78_6728 [Leptomonas seymouri]|uniref:Yip1 domain-containing protein n=1 Tax=Leptomonas seymouri TaxID=5684 RepID=A0A0N1PAG4_LEPSE|nr:hypothetical protein ABL78_6728 [Leptomonas seymouri]|eukprot:KPI84212.1 hypothetical protein ABL78_6728 [Leptomonas seymouri]
MSQQRPYEGFSYPTEPQSSVAGAGDTYFQAARTTPPFFAGSSGATGGVNNTGLTRRSAQHTSNNNNSNAAVIGATSNASPVGAGPVTVPISVASPSGGQFPGSYGYFHGHSNSIDVNSGYNSDVGSSVSNPHNVPSGGYPMTGPTPRVPVVMVNANETSNPTDVVPAQPPPLPPFAGARYGSAALGVNSGDGDGGCSGNRAGVFHTGGSEGRAGSTANSTRSSGSAQPPVAPPAFLPTRPFVQAPVLNASTPVGGCSQPHSHQQQPYMVPMPSSMQNAQQCSSNDLQVRSVPHDISEASRLPHMGCPSTGGPRMPVMPSDYAHGYASGGGAVASPSAGGRFFSRLMAQILPTFDDANAVNAQGGGGGGSIPRERPLHQLRFGNPEDDLPLLEELGIFPRHILDKACAVLNPFRMSVDAAKDTDLAGPILFAFSLALLLSLRGKIQFSAIYGLFVLGVGFFKILLSLMQSKGGGAPLQLVVSTVGYGLLPTVLLALVRTICSWLLTRRSVLPLTLLMTVWSAWCGSALVAKGLSMEEQRYLVLYPMLLFYAAFDALTVF